MRKRILGVALILAMLAMLAACGNSGNSQGGSTGSGTDGTDAASTITGSGTDGADTSDWIDLELSYATYLPENNPNSSQILALQDELDIVMPGKVNITIYASNSLLAQNDIYDGILSGTADIGLVDMGSVPERFPLTQIWIYPGLQFNTSEVASRAYMEWINTEKPAEYDDVVVIGVTGSGPLALLTQKPVHSIEDVQGLQIRCSSVAARTVEAWGAVPVSIPLSEVYEGLRSGLLDGSYNYAADFAKNKFYEVGKYQMICSLSQNCYMIAMNKERFASMPKSQQEAFTLAAQAAFDNVISMFQTWTTTAGGETWPGMDDEDPDLIASYNKLETYFLDPGTAEYEGFFNAGEGLQEAYVKGLDEKGLPGSETLEKILALEKKWNADFSWQDYKDLNLSHLSTDNVVNP
jgi:TRAP-type C4-dicarboxylate transport system substrate-binding protein